MLMNNYLLFIFESVYVAHRVHIYVHHSHLACLLHDHDCHLLILSTCDWSDTLFYLISVTQYFHCFAWYLVKHIHFLLTCHYFEELALVFKNVKSIERITCYYEFQWFSLDVTYMLKLFMIVLIIQLLNIFIIVLMTVSKEL